MGRPSLESLMQKPPCATEPCASPPRTSTSSAVEIIEPAQWTTPFIFASPHSGRRYPASFLEQSTLDLMNLRRSEDSYVDLLVDCVPTLGAPLLKAMFPRAFVDVNRSAKELDPLVFSGQLPTDSETRSNRVLAGFGVIPRLAADGLEIYQRKIPIKEGQARLARFYQPYHDALAALVAQALNKFGCAIIIDCHSMPSHSATSPFPQARGTTIGRGHEADFVLGDRYGTSCAPSLLSLTQSLLTEVGYNVARNSPYAGGFVTQAYGRPAEGVHTLQIEINRRLYLDETRITRTAGFAPLRSILRNIFTELTQIDPQALSSRQAAE